MLPLPQIDGVIDYAHHPMRSARLDVVLCAKARFFLGCTSGLAFLSMVFGVPVAQANMIPVSTLGLRHTDISIPKMIWSEPLGRYLSFPEIFNSEIGGYFFTHQYHNDGLRVVENDEEDIRGLVLDILGVTDTPPLRAELTSELQRKYLALFRTGHYSHGAASRISERFLMRHRSLL
jgi:putative glycosyltransferase (TIGR04372 family)